MLRILAYLVLLLAAPPLAAQEPAADPRVAAERMVAEFAVPGYAALLERAQEHRAAWEEFCGSSASDEGFSRLAETFAETVRAWSRVEILLYGPVSEDFRHERIAYWPERKNNVARSLSALLGGTDPLTADGIYTRSVAVQGLPVLERLLFDEGARDALTSGPEAERRCAIGTAVSGNVANIVSAIDGAWAPLAARLREGDQAAAREAVTRFATDLLTMFQIVGDAKLDVPAGDSAEFARPKTAQWWRSGLSAATIVLNLQAAADLAAIALGSQDEPSGTVAAARQAARLAGDLPAPLPEAVADERLRGRVLLLRDAVRGARDLAGANVPAALGVTLGFNSLDGD